MLAARMTAIPSIHFDVSYLITLTALVGTTIAPWQFFYLQAAFVEKKVGPRHYPQARLDVLFGASVAWSSCSSSSCARRRR